MSIYTCMLQEVHCCAVISDLWISDWGYQALFSYCTSNKAGVGIQFNNNFNFHVLKVFLDPNGDSIICDIKANGKPITLANIYAPNMTPTSLNPFSSIFQTFNAKKL